MSKMPRKASLKRWHLNNIGRRRENELHASLRTNIPGGVHSNVSTRRVEN